MSWIQKLCEVYDVMSRVEDCTIVPFGFTQKEIQYNIILSAEGEFVTAHELPKENKKFPKFIVPSTPEAEGRTTAKGSPYPLAEELKRLIPREDDDDSYLASLSRWCEFKGAPQCLRTLYKYLQRGTLLEDLKGENGIKGLKLDQDGSGGDAKSFACFSVQTLDGDSRLWMRKEVRQSWSEYTSSKETEGAELCYATGEVLPILETHPKFTKLSGNAKLISAKDAGYPFQYKGRFVEKSSAARISRNASIKAHNALKWLTEHQGFSKYGIHIVGWNVSKPALELYPAADPYEDEDYLDEEIRHNPNTFERYAKALRDAVEGDYGVLDEYSCDEELTAEARKRRDEIVILGLQAATDGRMSIIYYQEMPGNEYVKRLEQWEKQCRWEIPGTKNKRDLNEQAEQYSQENFEENKVSSRPPTWLEISEAVMGRDAVNAALYDFRFDKAATKQMREIQLRLLSCVINGGKLPEDMVKRAFTRSVYPIAFVNKKGNWDGFAWSRCTAITCAMIRKMYIDKAEDEPSLRLDVTRRDRDYLYGRLLAVAHKAELDTMKPKDWNRIKTKAVQAMSSFVQNPAKGWLHLYCKLLPELKELGKDGYSARKYQRLFGEIESLFLPEDRERQCAVSYQFLMGFSAQLRELYRKAEERQKAPEPIPYAVPKSRDELFGCMLAVADDCQWNVCAEKMNGYWVSSQDGSTNAMRLTSAFVARPCTVWGQIHDKLIPYLEKADGQRADWAQMRLCRIEQAFSREDRLSDAPLGNGFLHGYLSMYRALMRNDKEAFNNESWQLRKGVSLSVEDRNAAFGALLALENRVERYAMSLDPDPTHNRPANAIRFLQRASQRPNEVLPYLMERMRPYENKLRFPNNIREEKQRLEKLIDKNNWNTAEPLHPAFLHTFYTYEPNIYKGKDL